MNLAIMLRTIGACAPAREWAKGQTDLATAWNSCQRPDWMLWLLNELGHRDDRDYRLFAVWSIRHTPVSDGRTVWDLITDERSKNAATMAEAYANGEATEKELAAAWEREHSL